MFALLKRSFGAVGPAQQSPVKNFAVIGGGQMGTGIAIVAASVGRLNAQIVCENEKAASGCRAFVEAWIDKELKKSKVDEQGKQEFLRRVTYATDIGQASAADFVVEAVYESFELKR